jgi:hypothetical protein
MSLPTLPGTPPARAEAKNKLSPSGDSIGQPSGADEFTFGTAVAVLNAEKDAPCEFAWSEVREIAAAASEMEARRQALLRVISVFLM